jgi:hypothetical protein
MYEIEESKNKSERKVGGANNHFSEPTTSAKKHGSKQVEVGPPPE